MAAEVLMARGVPEERILFLNLIASPEGIKNFATKFPKLRVVTAFVDQVSATSRSSSFEVIIMLTKTTGTG
jgi:uracil phosphoribosyltransferase